MKKDTDYDDLCKRLRGSANFLDKAGFTGFPLIAKDCREAADSLEKQCDRKEHYKRILRDAEADNAALLSTLKELRIRFHAMGRRPEECYEMSLIDDALLAGKNKERD